MFFSGVTSQRKYQIRGKKTKGGKFNKYVYTDPINYKI